MGSRRITMRVNPQVLQWAIDSAGWSDDELASATRIGAGLIRRWKRRESEISLSDIRKIASKIKRPVSAFMLAEPPREPPVAGFRIGRGPPAGRPSKELCTAVRLARRIQYNAAELLGDSPRGPAPGGGRRAAAAAVPTDDPEEVAARESARMGPRDGGGGRGQDPASRHARTRRLYERSRDAVESQGAFVAQARFPVDEAKGFAITGGGPPVILVNSGDAVASRIFTLFHEYAHVLLDGGGSLCSPAPETLESADAGSGRAVEGWCDAFAASILMPRSGFLSALGGAGGRTVGATLAALSRTYLVSRRAALVRAIGLLKGADRRPYMDYYRDIGPPAPPAGAAGGRASAPAAACLGRLGRRYARLVVDSEESGRITEPDMGAYLDLGARHFDSLRAMVWDG